MVVVVRLVKGVVEDIHMDQVPAGATVGLGKCFIEIPRVIEKGWRVFWVDTKQLAQTHDIEALIVQRSGEGHDPARHIDDTSSRIFSKLFSSKGKRKSK